LDRHGFDAALQSLPPILTSKFKAIGLKKPGQAQAFAAAAGKSTLRTFILGLSSMRYASILWRRIAENLLGLGM
jgi:hypothetical protein